MTIEISLFLGGARDTAITASTLRTFANFDTLVRWFESLDPCVRGVPAVAAPRQDENDEPFKAALAPYKINVPMFVPFTFRMGAVTKRRDAAVSMSVLVIEIDSDFGDVKSTAVQSAIRAHGWRGFVYSTFSHRAARPCYRFVLELSRPASAERTCGLSEADHVRDVAMALLGGSQLFDAKESGFHYFVPSCPEWAKSEAVFEDWPGRAIDVASLLQMPAGVVVHARDYAAPSTTRAVAPKDLQDFITQHEKRAVRGTDPGAQRRLQIACAIRDGQPLPGPHRDTALFAFFGAFRHWFDDKFGAAPCPRSMHTLCARADAVTHGLSKPPVEATFSAWNAGHDAAMAEKRKLRAQRDAEARERTRAFLDALPIATPTPKPVVSVPPPLTARRSVNELQSELLAIRSGRARTT